MRVLEPSSLASLSSASKRKNSNLVDSESRSLSNPASKYTYTYTQNTITQPQLKAATLTHVRSQRGDQLGNFLAWVSLVPVFIIFKGFVSHFIFRRKLQGMFFVLGLLISQFISKLTKKSVQQARPETCAFLEMCDSQGWPSSHSQYMFFFATYFTLLTCKEIGFWVGLKNRWVMNFLHWSLALLTMCSRVYLGYHTMGQVFSGAILGILLRAVWFWMVTCVCCIVIFLPLKRARDGGSLYQGYFTHI